MKAGDRKSVAERKETPFPVHKSLHKYTCMLPSIYYLKTAESCFLLTKTTKPTYNLIPANR